MLSAQRWLFAPPFAVSFPCKVNKRECVENPENIPHTPPLPLPTEGNGNSEWRAGGSKRRQFPRGVGCLQSFSRGLSKIGELLINSSFSVEQAISYFTVTNVSKQVS